jgi:hypothetical protein
VEQKKLNLSPFKTWLIEVRCLADSTAAVYASVVRRDLTCMDEDLSEDAVTLHFVQVERDRGRKDANMRRSVWRRFVEFAADQGQALANPRKLASGLHDSPADLPQEVRAALHWLTAKNMFSIKHIPHLKWTMFTPDLSSLPHLTLQDPYNRGVEIHIPREYTDALKAWSGAYVGSDTPLLPLRPLSQTPYDFMALRRELRRYKRSIAAAAEPPPSDLDQAALAETEAILAARQGVNHHGRNTPDPDFKPTRSTQALLSMIEEGEGAQRGIPGHTEDETPSSARDREPSASSPSVPPPVLGLLDEAKLGRRASEASEVSGLQPESKAVGPHQSALAAALPPPFPPLPSGSGGPPCVICGYPRSVHAVSYGLTDGSISNCAAENGHPEDTCQMCDNGCYGRHDFRAAL